MGSGSLGWFNESYGGNHGIVTNNVAIRKNTTSSDFGSLLVRTPPNAAPVSAPAAISLLALGLCGLALRRRRTVSE